MTLKNTKIPTLAINKTQKRLYAASSDPTFEHATRRDMEAYLKNPTAYIGQILYCKEEDKHYRIAKGETKDQKILKDIGGGGGSVDSEALENIKNQVNEMHSNQILRIVENLDEANAIEGLKDGIICFVNEDKVYYSRENDEWKIFKGDTGGVSVGTLECALDGTTFSKAIGETIPVDLLFNTPNIGKGTLYVTSNNKELMKKQVDMGTFSIALQLEKGEHKVQIYVKDRAGVFTNIVKFTVQCGGLEIDSNFDWDDIYDAGTEIEIPFTIDTISEEEVVAHLRVGEREFTQTVNNTYNVFKLPKDIVAGIYSVELYATSGDYTSKKIIRTLSILDSGSLFLHSLFNTTSQAEQGDQILIDFKVLMKGQKKFNVVYRVNSNEHSRGEAVSGSNLFAISTLPLGQNTVTIEVTTLDQSKRKSLSFSINIVPSTYELQKPVIDASLVAYFDATDRSNLASDRNLLKDKRTNAEIGTLHNFNFNTNGWIEDGLKMNGRSFAKLDIQPFLKNARNGLTIDIEFKTEDIGNENARVLDCTTKLESGVGCYIDTGMAQIKSKDNTVTSPFAQGEKTRATYVIDRDGGITKLYINAVMSSVARLTDSGTGADKKLEDFEHDDFIYLNSTRGETNFGDCTIYNIRIYNRALSSKEVLTNHIADIKDKEEQKKKYDFNFKDTIPTMTFKCDKKAFEEMSKSNAVTMQIEYVSTDTSLYGQSFDLGKCSVKWQGTSSIVYAVKNYKIKLKNDREETVKHALREGMIKESTFVLKADYMESSHANNTGLAKIVNKYLYDEPLPPKKEHPDRKIVSAIDGFPVKLYLNDDLMGIFNFNLDKGNDESFGFDEENENCLSYEISANTDTTAGAFFKWTGPTAKYHTELEYLKADFEQRFPDEDDKPDYGYDKLKELVDWVSDADDATFRREFEDHFNKEYTFKYIIFVLVMGMVDNLGKNMMISTWDGKIWFPCFYDLDTCLSLDNSGYIKFDVDIEMEAGTYNTSSSNLWTKVLRVFEKEIYAMYRDMRSKQFKEENLFSVLIGEQIDQIPEMLYNYDSEKKYLEHPQYIHMLHGSRREHMRKWLTERLLYLDSKMGYEMNTKQSITIRANNQGTVAFNIKTYSPMYVKVKWRNDNDSIALKKIKRNETVTFSYDLPTATDQEILIYSAKHLKDIGDISAMKPSSLTLGEATRLTKLICRDSENLQALGLGGVSSDGTDKRLKYLKEIDLTGCGKLGTIDSSKVLDVSYCDNLTILKAHGTNFQSIQFNTKGGNLEEIYLPNSITSLRLANQYSLKKVEFPGHSNTDRLAHRYAYAEGSQITDLVIEDCPSLVDFGLDRTTIGLNTSVIPNYRDVLLKDQPDNFDISFEDYKQAFKLSSFGRLETVSITNSLLNYKYYNVNASPNLTRISFEKMPELKGLIITGNRTYGAISSNVYENLEGTPRFDKLSVKDCGNFDTLILQRPSSYFQYAYKFPENFVWDLSELPIKRFICNISLQNLKKLILPNGIEEFSHSETYVLGDLNEWTPTTDKSYAGYKASDSPLETIIINGYEQDQNFQGIDFGNKPLNNVSLNGLVKKVGVIQNIDCKAIDLNPRLVPELLTDQAINSIRLDFNEYKGSTLYGVFRNVDLANIEIVLDNEITVPNMDYSYMFQNAKHVEWEKIKTFIEKLPKGKLYSTFKGCDADKLAVGNMLGLATTSLRECFRQMSNITEIDLRGANTENVTDYERVFDGTGNLRTIHGLNDLNVQARASKNFAFQGCGIETLDVSNWNFSNGGYSSFAQSCPNINTLKIKAQGSLWTLLNEANPEISNIHFINNSQMETEFSVYTFPSEEGSVECNMEFTNVVITDVNNFSGLAKRNLPIKSMYNIFNALKDYRNQNGRTINIGKKNLDKLDDSYIRIATAKNWSVIE